VYLVALSSHTAIARDGDFQDTEGYYLHRALIAVAPNAVASQTRRVGSFNVGGTRRVLWVAPTRDGGYCYQLDPGFGGCRSKYDRNSAAPAHQSPGSVHPLPARSHLPGTRRDTTSITSRLSAAICSHQTRIRCKLVTTADEPNRLHQQRRNNHVR
jgi:hypothetical protein